MNTKKLEAVIKACGELIKELKYDAWDYITEHAYCDPNLEVEGRNDTEHR